MVTGIVEVDMAGKVVATDTNPLCPPELVFGTSAEALQGAHIARVSFEPGHQIQLAITP